MDRIFTCEKTRGMNDTNTMVKAYKYIRSLL